MITNTGKSIIIKYLLGQAPSYASYIAVGCGARPLSQMTYSVINRAFVDSSDEVTLTLDSVHNFVVGDYVTISSVSSFFDGTYQLISGTTNSIIKYIKVSSAANISALGTNLNPATDAVGKASHNYSYKKSLDYEMFRIPITSRGFVTEDGASKVVLTANLPSADRYEITELGVYPAVSNPSAQLSDSRSVYNFVGGEGWEYHSSMLVSDIPVATNKLDFYEGDPGLIYAGADPRSEINDGTGANPGVCFIADSSNSTLRTEVRVKRFELQRNLGQSIYLQGDSSELIDKVAITGVTYTSTTATYTTLKPHGLFVSDSVTITGLAPDGYNSPSIAQPTTFLVITAVPTTNSFTVGNTTNAVVTDGVGLLTLPRLSLVSGTHIHNISNAALQYLDNSSPLDKLNLAFSVVNRNAGVSGETGSDIDSVKVSIRFGNGHDLFTGTSNFAQMDISLNASSINFVNDRYFVSSKELQSLAKRGSFTWSNVDTVLVYASILNSAGSLKPQYYVSFDGLRLENVSSANPLYGLVGYSVIENQFQGINSSFPQPISKLPNTSNFVEFRYSMDVI